MPFKVSIRDKLYSLFAFFFQNSRNTLLKLTMQFVLLRLRAKDLRRNGIYEITVVYWNKKYMKVVDK